MCLQNKIYRFNLNYQLFHFFLVISILIFFIGQVLNYDIIIKCKIIKILNHASRAINAALNNS